MSESTFICNVWQTFGTCYHKKASNIKKFKKALLKFTRKKKKKTTDSRQALVISPYISTSLCHL